MNYSQLTETQSETNAVEFTTLTCIPGNLLYNDVRIQVSYSIQHDSFVWGYY